MILSNIEYADIPYFNISIYNAIYYWVMANILYLQHDVNITMISSCLEFYSMDVYIS